MNPAAGWFKTASRSRYFVSHEISPFERSDTAGAKQELRPEPGPFESVARARAVNITPTFTDDLAATLLHAASRPLPHTTSSHAGHVFDIQFHFPCTGQIHVDL
jgi:hypothetical protein